MFIIAMRKHTKFKRKKLKVLKSVKLISKRKEICLKKEKAILDGSCLITNIAPEIKKKINKK